MADLPLDLELDERLRDLSGIVAFPATPDLASSVSAVIATSSSRPPARFGPRYAYAIAAALLIAIVAVVAIPTTRHAVARWFDVPGIHISWPDGDSQIDVRAEIRIGLGDRVTLEEAESQVPFTLSLPADDRANAPDEVFFNATVADDPAFPAGVVSFVYYAGNELPAVEGTTVGLLITQFVSDESVMWASKMLFVDSRGDIVQVNGEDALWIPDSHAIVIQSPLAGETLTPEARSTGSVLIWNSGDITYRIEGNLPLAEMLAIAESMEPITP